jgi:signal transduction histidine kinase
MRGFARRPAPATGGDLLGGALLLGVLATFIAAVYATIVVGGGAALGTDIPNTGLSIVAIAVVAGTFERVRALAQRAINRLLYGERATPYEVLSQFSARVAGTYSTEDVLPNIARVIADGTGASRAEVWLRVGPALSLAAAWPDTGAVVGPRALAGDGLPEMPAADRSVAVRHQGELLGALTISKRAGDVVRTAEDKLLSDIASQAGLVLRNVRLTTELEARLAEISAQTEELHASRGRIVAAQDAERRRLEQDIHDGAQQHLVALAVKARMTKSLAARDPDRARGMLGELRSLCDVALETLRDLSVGIYPPLLAQRGVATALRAHARVSGLRVAVEARGIGRLPPDVEAAAYFSCLEALQNAAKHAEASRVTVRLERPSPGELRFEVADDGVGFDLAAVRRGAGLQSMADRMATLGGRLEIRSSAGAGTIVAGRVPLHHGEVGS